MRILRIYYFEYTLFEKLLVIAAVEKFIYRFPFPQPCRRHRETRLTENFPVLSAALCVVMSKGNI